MRFLIISPDPETSKAVTLSLELNGHEVERVVNPKTASGKNYSLALYDIPSWDDDELTIAANTIKAFTKRGLKSAVVLPHGYTKPPPYVKAAAVITRPFELVSLTSDLEKLALGS